LEGGLRIAAHIRIASLRGSLPANTVSTRRMPIPGWTQHLLGERASEFGVFSVEIVGCPEGRVQAAFLSHRHPFYDVPAHEDAERRVFHEGIIATDLVGQREFSWGHVFCRLDPSDHRDWFCVIYTPFSGVPLRESEIYRVLMEHETPTDR
jgi:hypothetical protein